MTRLAAVILLMIVGALAVYSLVIPSEPDTIVIGNVRVEIETARTSEEKTLGLSGRKNLPRNRGLLFIYDQPDFYGIWMKDMNFPIDIIWFDTYKKVVNISKNVKPESFPEVFLPDNLALYVLEVNAGFTDENGIKIGDKMDE